MTYILQDRMDPRLYFKGLDPVSNRPAFTANEENAPIFIDSDVNYLSAAHNLNKIKRT